MGDKTLCDACGEWADCDEAGHLWNHACRPREHSEEEYLMERLAAIRREYELIAAPIVERLQRIQAAKPIVVTIHRDQIDSRVLEALKCKEVLDV